MVRVELADPEGTLLREIADPQLTRDDVAMSYAMAMRGTEQVDWPKVNRAILERWSMAGLKYVKTEAWKLVQPAPEAGDTSTSDGLGA